LLYNECPSIVSLSLAIALELAVACHVSSTSSSSSSLSPKVAIDRAARSKQGKRIYRDVIICDLFLQMPFNGYLRVLNFIPIA
jgi:hypothetical protein